MKMTNSIYRFFGACLLTVFLMFSCMSVVAEAVETGDKTVNNNSAGALIELESYSVEGGVIEPGKDVTFKLVLHNANASTPANNVVMTLTCPSGMAYPIYGTDNQTFVGTVLGGATKEVTVPLTISSKFTADVLDLTCKFDYETKGSKASNSSSMIVPTSAGNTLYVKSVNVSKNATVNGSSLFSIIYTNYSGSNIENAKLIIDGAVSAESQNIELNTILAGKTYNEDYNISFTQTGTQQISAKIVYTSDKGTAEEIDLGTFNVNVTVEAQVKSSDPMTRPEIVWGTKAVTALSLLAGAIAIIVYIKKK